MTNPVNPLVPVTVPASAHTLQAMIELVYVKAANDVLYDHMVSLHSSLRVTREANDLLTGLQNLHNQIRVVPRGSFGFDYASGYRNYEAAYQHQASDFFGKPVMIAGGSNYILQSLVLGPDNVWHLSVMAGFSSFMQQIIGYRTQLSTQLIPALSATTPKSSSGAVDPNSLLANLISVLSDLHKYNLNTTEGAQQWLVDNYNGVLKSVKYVSGVGNNGSVYQSQQWVFTSFNANAAGLIQQNLTNALTAAQSLNTVQTESVRNYLFMFEEYYKSAAAMLQQITQIIRNMAQNIAQ